MADNDSRKWEKARSEDDKSLRTAFYIFGGIAVGIVLVIVITISFHASEPIKTATPSQLTIDPSSTFSKKHFSPVSLALTFAELDKQRRESNKPTVLLPQQAAGLYEHFTNARDGFEYAGAILSMSNAMPNDKKVLQDFLSGVTQTGGDGDATKWRKYSAWLETFKPASRLSLIELEKVLTSFLTTVSSAIKSAPKDINRQKALLAFLRLCTTFTGERGEASQFTNVVLASLADMDEANAIAALEYLGHFLSPDNVVPLTRMLGEKSSDTVYASVVKAIGKMGVSSAANVMLSSMAGRPDPVKRIVLTSLSSMNLEPVFSKLLAIVTNGGPQLAPHAITTMTAKPENCILFAAQLDKLLPRIDASTAVITISSLRNCPDDALPYSILLSFAIRGDTQRDAAIVALRGRSFKTITKGYSAKVHSESLVFAASKPETAVLQKFLLTCADTSSGRLAIANYEAEMKAGMNIERIDFLLRLLAASYSASQTPEYLEKLRAISQECPNDIVRRKAIEIVKGF